MVAFRSGITRRRRWFILLTLSAFGMTLCIGAFLWHSVQTSSVVAIQNQIDLLRPAFTAIRLLVISAVALVWPVVTQGLCRWGRVDEATAAQLLSLRWRIVTWLLVIELMLGQNLIGRFLSTIQGSAA